MLFYCIIKNVYKNIILFYLHNMELTTGESENIDIEDFRGKRVKQVRSQSEKIRRRKESASCSKIPFRVGGKYMARKSQESLTENEQVS